MNKQIKAVLSALLITAGMFFAANSMAAESCEKNAQDAALAIYEINAGVIQGGDVQVESVENITPISASSKTFEVQLSDGNEDGEMWTVFFHVKMRVPGCHIRQVTEKKVVAK